MAPKYKNTSVYKNTKLRNYYLDIFEPPIVSNLEKYNHRPDLLAYDLYGQSELWWIFTFYNRDTIKNPIYDFKSGTQIKIPKNITDIGF